MIAVMSVAMASCDDWDSPYYVNDVVGCWESYYGYDGYGEYDITGYHVERYDFYSNYTGRLSFYSYMGPDYIDFEWETHGNHLDIWYIDGDHDYLYYGFNDFGYLILSPSRRFHQYKVYRPVGFYKQGMGIDSGQAKRFDPATDVKPTTANAVKE